MSGSRIWMALVVSAVVGSLASEASGQAWVQPKGGYYFKLTGSYLNTDQEFDFQGYKQPIGEADSTRMDSSYREVDFTAYLQYGLSDRFTLVTQLPFKVATTQEIQNLGASFPERELTLTNGGFSDLWVSLTTPLFQGPLAASLRGGIKIPMGYEKEPDNNGPALGTGEMDADIRLYMGQSLYPLPSYLVGMAGYRFRGGDFHDQYWFEIETGYTGPKLFAKVELQIVKSTVAPPDLSGGSSAPPPPNGTGNINEVLIGDQDYTKVIVETNYRFRPSFSVTLEAYSTVAGKNTLAGTTVAAGIILRKM